MKIKIKSLEQIQEEFAASYLDSFPSYTCGLYPSDIELIEGKWFVVLNDRPSCMHTDYRGWVVRAPDGARYHHLFIIGYLVEEIEEDED